MNTLPSTFCWTKVGQEAGEDVAAIRRRKEWERQLGHGRFFWGIGQSLGDNALLTSAMGTPLPVLFSPMPSKAKSIDTAPSGVVLWNSWVDTDGCPYPLPDYCLITSRSHLPSGRAKARHYALVCMSDHELDERLDCWISPQHLRNAGTNSTLGASQVTAVVRLAESSAIGGGTRRYPVIFVADLRPPYFVRLAEPTPLAESDIAQIKDVCAAGDVESWRMLVCDLRSRVQPGPGPAQQALGFGSAAETPLEECFAQNT
jgi:hypothetical protein